MSTKTARATKAEANVVCPSDLEGSTLPRDWEWVSLGNICRTTSGGTPSRKNKEYFEGDIPWVKSGELPDGPVLEIEEYITGEAVKNSSAKQFPKGTLLIALYGATVGKLGLLTQEAATNQAVCAIFPPDDLETKYLFWYLRFVRSDLLAQAIGGAQPNISQGILRNLLIPIAPLYQQKRIVAEIEKQFSRLDEAVTTLKRVKANLKRYKASVLKAAIEGHLVEAEVDLASREGRSYETGEQLLQRTLDIRRREWNGKGKYKVPAEPDANYLLELPEGWVWATVEVICARIVDCPHSTPRFQGAGYPCIDTTWMTTEGLVVERARFVDQAAYQERIVRLEPEPGDIVFAREGTIGTAIVIPDHMKPCLGQRVMLLRTSELFSSRLLMHTLHSELVKVQYRAQALGSTVPHINVGDVKRFAIPVPPLAEQHRIVGEVDRRLSVIEELEAAVQANLTRADRLRQSILSQAFSGCLLEQDTKHIPAILPTFSVAAESQARYGRDDHARR